MFRSFLHKKRGCHSILLPAAGCGENPVANPGNPLDRLSVRSLKTLLAALVLYIFLADLVVGIKIKINLYPLSDYAVQSQCLLPLTGLSYLPFSRVALV